MDLKLHKVDTPAERDRFIRFPMQLYRDQPFWVPPLHRERKRFLDPGTNPFFEHAEVDLFLARQNGQRPVGRVAVIEDRAYNAFHGERTGFFGMFDTINEPAVADRLLTRAREWARDHGLHRLVGPMSLSTNHECGLLVEGFDSPPMVGIPYNPPYYAELLTRCGFGKAKDLLSFKIDHPRTLPRYLERASERIGRKNHFSLRTLQKRRFDEELARIWEIYNSAWESNWGFVPMTQKEFTFSAGQLKSVIDPDLCLIAECGGEPVGFSLTVPDVNQVLKKMNGTLFPLGWWQFLWNRKKIDRYRTLTLGVKPSARGRGIDVLFYTETFRRCIERKIARAEMSWILEDNAPMIAPLRRMGAVEYRRHRIYERSCLH